MRVDPNRFNALYGAGRAAELTLRTENAAAYYEQLLKNCGNRTNSNRQELATARANYGDTVPADLRQAHEKVVQRVLQHGNCTEGSTTH